MKTLFFITLALLSASFRCSGDPCLSYEDPQTELKCLECDSGYVRILAGEEVLCGTTDYFTDPEKTACTLHQYPNKDLSEYSQYSFQVATNQAPDEAETLCYSCSDLGCSSCGSNGVSLREDVRAELVLNQYSDGCLTCPSGSKATIDDSTVIGKTLRKCSSSSNNCNFNEFDDGETCQQCSAKFLNCAVCNSEKCLMCNGDFYAGTWLNMDQQPVDMCAYRMCNEDQGPNLHKGHTKCLSCQTSNCIQCEHSAPTGSSTLQESCTMCKRDFYLSYDSQAETYSCQPKLLGPQSLALFVRPTPALTSDIDMSYLESGLDGLTLEKAFPFITQALNYAEQQAAKYAQTFEVSIYLTKGDHFLFHCDSRVYTPSSVDQTDAHFDYCAKFDSTLQPLTTQQDNIKYIIQSMDCNLIYKLDYDQNEAKKSLFKEQCISIISSETKALVYVQHPTFYFNITNYAEFDNVRFIGINAFAKADNPQVSLQYFPRKFCDLEQEPQGVLPKGLYFQKTQQNTKFGYQCIDPFYVDVQAPSSYNENSACEQGRFNQRKSTGACSGEPYGESFFNQQLPNGRQEQRRKVLFNLYGFNEYFSSNKKAPTLVLRECEFMYFLYDYESLINVETNNLYRPYKRPDSKDPFNYYYYQGRDKGASINIKESVFKHSRFCKGMIVYRRAPFVNDMEYIFNFTQQFGGRDPIYTDNKLIMSKSQFYSLNYVTSQASMQAWNGHKILRQLYSSYSEQRPLFYQAFIHKGIVLNIEDFDGPIQIEDSLVTKNFIYISDILMGNHTKSTQVGVDKSFFFNQRTNEYDFVACDRQTQLNTYLLDKAITQETDLDELFDVFERLAVIYISRPKQKMILIRNNFEKNIALFGGAVTINSPDFINGKEPFIFMQENAFQQNMAYLSGNAVFIRNTRLVDDVDQMCAGITINNNQFTENIGTKRSNGGAVSLVCKVLGDVKHEDYESTSSYLSLQAVVDPYKDQIYDLGDAVIARISYQINYFSTTLSNNSFKSNYAGLKGTSIYSRNLSILKIINSQFQNNGPVMQKRELQFSPYIYYLSKRQLTYFDPQSQCLDELDYIEDCQAKGIDIDWPVVQGSIYAEHCQDNNCFHRYQVQILEITDSLFYSNNMSPVFSPMQNPDQATSIVIKGGLDNLLKNNQFISHKGQDDHFLLQASLKIKTFQRNLPDDYLEHSLAPIVKISVNVDRPDYKSKMEFKTTFENCTFQDNKHMQLTGFGPDFKFKGSLISYSAQYSSRHAPNIIPKLVITKSTFRENAFIGTSHH